MTLPLNNRIDTGIQHEDLPVYFNEESECFIAQNEGGHNFTQLNVSEILQWIMKERPDILRRECSEFFDENLDT